MPRALGRADAAGTGAGTRRRRRRSFAGGCDPYQAHDADRAPETRRARGAAEYALGMASGSTTPAGDVVETRGLTKRFGARTAVDGVDLHVPAGTAFGFLGPN